MTYSISREPSSLDEMGAPTLVAPGCSELLQEFTRRF